MAGSAKSTNPSARRYEIAAASSFSRAVWAGVHYLSLLRLVSAYRGRIRRLKSTTNGPAKFNLPNSYNSSRSVEGNSPPKSLVSDFRPSWKLSATSSRPKTVTLRLRSCSFHALSSKPLEVSLRIASNVSVQVSATSLPPRWTSSTYVA